MLLDKKLMVASAQNITVTTAVYSEDYVPITASQIAAGEPFSLFVNVTEAQSIATTLTVEIILDEDGAGTNAVVLGKTEAITITDASATAPKQIVVAAKAPHSFSSKDCLLARFTVGGASSDTTLDAYIHPSNAQQTAGIN